MIFGKIFPFFFLQITLFLHKNSKKIIFRQAFSRSFTMAGITYEIDDKNLVEQIKSDAMKVAAELVGSHSVPEVGKAIYDGLQSVFGANGIYIAAQCCEHLNRAIIIEHEAVPNAEIVNVVPQPKAGGSFATACYASFKAPVALEHIKANAGIDIGGTLIGMHLREVAVPVRLKQNHIGKAIIIAARTRPKFIGGERAHYNEALKDGYPEF